MPNFSAIYREKITTCKAWRNTVAVCFIVFVCFAHSAWADQTIIIISSSGAPVYERTVNTIDTQLRDRGLSSRYRLQRLRLDRGIDLEALELMQSPALIITVGSAAAAFTLEHFPERPVICSFITRSAFASISERVFPTSNSVTALYIDQPITRLLKLASLLRAEQSPYKISMLSQQSMAQLGLANEGEAILNDSHISSLMLSKDDNPIKKLEPLMKNSDVFIVRPNTNLFNRLVAKLVLQLSMRYKTPVIGFSKKYADAGAMLSLYASPEDIGRDAAKLIAAHLSASNEVNSSANSVASQADISPGNLAISPVINKHREGSEFSIAVNQRIARKMGFTLEAKQLKHRLQQLEAE